MPPASRSYPSRTQRLQTISPDSIGGASGSKAIWIGLFLVAYAIFSIGLKNELRKEKSPLEQLPLGQTMPDFTLLDTRGNEYTLSKLAPQNKVILINFWASWCQPCRLEMPEFAAMDKADAKKGLLILAIDEDHDREQFVDYLRHKPASFPILLDPEGRLAERLGIRAYPTTVLVSADGRIKAVYEGLDQFMRFRVEALLNAKSSAAGSRVPAATPVVPPGTLRKTGDQR